MKKKLILIFFSSILIISSCSKSGPATPPGNPTPAPSIVISTTNIVDITANSARSGGNISSDGGGAITARGICWSTSPNPTTANNKNFDGTGIGFFFSKMTGLSLATTYYVRAYGTNILGTVYGNELSFTTAASITPPSFITTDPVSSILSSTAVCGGYVGLDGGAPITARGVCWNTSPNPTTANSKTVDGSGEGNFTSNLTGLAEKTVYYVRAYATNSAGTAYGNEFSFKTFEAGIMFIGGSNNNFYALNALTGQLKWKYSGTNWFSYADPCFANGKIYAGSIDHYLYCMDTLNGNVNWRFLTGSGIESAPVYDNGTIYFGSDDDYLYAVDANTGALKWRFLTGFNVSTSPVIVNGVVYFGSDDTKVYALNASNGQLVWFYPGISLINQSSPTIANGILYIGSRDGYLYALNINNGSLAWRYSANGNSLEMSSPTVVNNIVYIGGYGSGSSTGGVYAINATTGSLVWEAYQNGSFDSSPIVADGQLFITSDLGELIAMDAATGLHHWSRTILSNGASPTVMNGIVYVGGGGGNYIYAIDAINGSDKWRFSVNNCFSTSGPCIVTSTSAKHSGKSGMQQ